MDEPAVSDDLLCPICLAIFEEPVSAHCGHSFCKTCLYAINRAIPECPVCRKPISSYNLAPNVTLSAIVEKYHVNKVTKKPDHGIDAPIYLMDECGFDKETFSRFIKQGISMPYISCNSPSGLTLERICPITYSIDPANFPVNSVLADNEVLVNKFVVIKFKGDINRLTKARSCDIHKDTHPGLLVEVLTPAQSYTSIVELSVIPKSIVYYRAQSIIFETVNNRGDVLAEMGMCQARYLSPSMELDFPRSRMMNSTVIRLRREEAVECVTPRHISDTGRDICDMINNIAKIHFGSVGYRTFVSFRGSVPVHTNTSMQNLSIVKYISRCLILNLNEFIWVSQLILRLSEERSILCGSNTCKCVEPRGEGYKEENDGYIYGGEGHIKPKHGDTASDLQGDCSNQGTDESESEKKNNKWRPIDKNDIDKIFCEHATDTDIELYLFYRYIVKRAKFKYIYRSDIPALASDTVFSRMVDLISSGKSSWIFIILIVILLYLLGRRENSFSIDLARTRRYWRL